MTIALCPVCSRLCYNSEATAGDQQPRPLDLTICDTCGTILTFTPEMQLRQLGPDESASIMARDDVQHVIKAVARLHAKRARLKRLKGRLQ
jgi:coenzyme F420-reducing hydrogenase beta subunit